MNTPTLIVRSNENEVVIMDDPVRTRSFRRMRTGLSMSMTMAWWLSMMHWPTEDLTLLQSFTDVPRTIDTAPHLECWSHRDGGRRARPNTETGVFFL